LSPASAFCKLEDICAFKWSERGSGGRCNQFQGGPQNLADRVTGRMTLPISSSLFWGCRAMPPRRSIWQVPSTSVECPYDQCIHGVGHESPPEYYPSNTTAHPTCGRS
jgi:hypothetical protein